MNKYKVYGDKSKKYYTIVTAENASKAWDYVVNNDNIKWIQLDSSDSIEVYYAEPTTEQIYELLDETDISDKALGKGPKKYLTGVFTNSRN